MMETLSFLFTTTFFPPYHIGGDATHVYHLSCELAKHGHEVHVIHSLDSYYWQKKDNPELTQYPLPDNVTIHSLKSPIGKAEPILSYLSGIPFSLRKKVSSLVTEINPDILHHHNIAGFGPWVFGLDAPVKLYTAHDHWLICPIYGCLNFKNRLCYSPSNCVLCTVLSGKPPQCWRYTNYLQNKLRNIDVIISPSEYLKGRLIESGIILPIEVIPNFIPEPSEPGPRIFKDPYFLYVGVLENHKGILDLINIFHDIDARNHKKLVIAGNGSEYDYIKKIISKNNLNDNILLLGRVDESKLSNLYSYADAVIIPSKFFENCPMVGLESIAHGTPIISSAVGGLPEITGKIDTRLVYHLAEELRGIITMFEKNTYQQSFIKNSYIQNYSTKNVDKYLELIRSDSYTTKNC